MFKCSQSIMESGIIYALKGGEREDFPEIIIDMGLERWVEGSFRSRMGAERTFQVERMA